MASENVEIVKRAYAALADGGVDALVPLLHPDAEFTTPPGLAAEPDTYRGEEGLRRYFDSFYEVMDDIRFEPLNFEAVGDRVLVETNLKARGKATGLEVEQYSVAAWQVREAKLFGGEIYPTLDEAREAARAAEGG